MPVWISIIGVALGVAFYTGNWGPCNDDTENDNSMTVGSSLRQLMDANAAYADQSMHQHHHKPVFKEEHAPLFPLTPSDYYGLGLTVLGLMVAAGGGIGGGGILVPIYILIMGFSPKHAIPLSNITVFGGAIANTVLNIKKRHPLADRPLVDWDLILVMEPLTIAGALIGAFLNKMLPELLLTFMLVVLLSFTAWESLKKAVKMYKAETAAMKLKPDGTKESELTRMAAAVDDDDDASDDDEEILLEKMEQQDDDKQVDITDSPADTMKEIMKPPPIDPERQKIQEELEMILEEERKTPMANLKILFTMFVVVLVINVLKGGGAFRSPLGIKCGSISFWIANGIILGWILFISILVRNYLVKKYEAKERCGFKYVEGDIRWDSRATIVYPCICCTAGLFAGMFGVGTSMALALNSNHKICTVVFSSQSCRFLCLWTVGGGIVKGPLMLAMGVHPAVGSASSACMILFTSFTATTSFIVFGLLIPDYAWALLIVGFLATLAGQIGLSYLMRKAQRNSYIAFSIGGVVLLSAFLMTIQSMLSMAAGEKHHSGGICGKGD
jgi:uncharacterized membrane protein YfcA